MHTNTLAFDDLLSLAQDPKALEDFRQKEVNAIIDQAPAYLRERLRGLPDYPTCNLGAIKNGWLEMRINASEVDPEREQTYSARPSIF